MSRDLTIFLKPSLSIAHLLPPLSSTCDNDMSKLPGRMWEGSENQVCFICIYMYTEGM